MSNELESLFFTEKWRPKTIEEVICSQKDMIYDSIKNPKTISSFLFSSVAPGTGKTSMAKAIGNELQCDMLQLNASMDRGIDSIRVIIKEFAQCISSKEGVKRMIFLDEADGMTSQAQECLKSPMETYSDNVFFILSCNNLNRIIPAIRSRCVIISFDNPSKALILERLLYICQNEKINYDIEDLVKLRDLYYPDIRAMILSLQHSVQIDYFEYENFYKAIKMKDLDYLYKKTYSGSFNLMGFNDFFFQYLYKHYNEFTQKQIVEISQLLADTEKAWNLSSKLPIIFLANIVKITTLL